MKPKLSSLFVSLLFLLACSSRDSHDRTIDQNSYFDQAFDYRDKNLPDSAFIFFYKAKDQFLSVKDSLGVGKSLINMGIILTEEGDYFGGQETSIQAMLFLNDQNIKHHSYLAANYNNLGIAADNLKDYKNAIKFYDSALSFSNDSASKRMYLNNKAKSLQELAQYDRALVIYRQILKSADNSKEYARLISNIAKTEWLKSSKYDARASLLTALNIRKKEQDIWGQNASYAQLADYYAAKNPKLAMTYAQQMYEIALKLKSPDDQLEALQKLIILAPNTNTKSYYNSYRKLSDSLQTARNAAKNQFALIRYETEKHKADNLILQKENSERKYQIIIISSIALFVLLGGIFWYRKRKRDIETESQKAITDSKLKTSKKVHDVVANGLYRVMTEIENQQDLDRDLVLDKIEDLYEKSRDISYEKPTEANKPFHETLSEILTSFATAHRKVLIAGNDAELWLKVSEQTKYELEHIIQELMVNMKKHSQASNVVMRFESVGEQIKIYYTDNGIGMPKQKQFNNGLRNTGNRIEEINGAIIFDTEVEKGLKIQISFPIS